MEELALIVPVYNEEEIIETVINHWVDKLDDLKIQYKIFVYNNDSEDNTKEIMSAIAQKNKNIVLINKKNEGHGSSVLKGYKELSKDYKWLFQIDSDNEMTSETFEILWENRDKYDFLIAKRSGRVQNLSRKFVSLISRWCVWLFYGKAIWDVNCPYRLMKSEVFSSYFSKIPDNTLSPNLILSGIVAKKKISYLQYLTNCSPRKTGKVSLQKMKLLKVAIKSFWQCCVFSFIVE